MWYFGFTLECPKEVSQKKLMPPPCPPNRRNTVTYLPKTYGKSCTCGRSSIFNWVLNLIYLFIFFWSFKSSFWMYSQWKRHHKVITFWNIYDTSMLNLNVLKRFFFFFSENHTRCGIWITCFIPLLVHQFFKNIVEI